MPQINDHGFFPRVDLHQYRSRLESTLAYALLQNISFNVGVVDFYDTAMQMLIVLELCAFVLCVGARSRDDVLSCF